MRAAFLHSKTKDLFIPGLLNSKSHSGPPWMQITFVVQVLKMFTNKTALNI